MNSDITHYFQQASTKLLKKIEEVMKLIIYHFKN